MNESAGGPDTGPPDASEPVVLNATQRWLGWRTRIRPFPALTSALGAAGGLLVIIGVIALGADQAADDGSGTAGASFCAVTILVALVAMIVGTEPVRAGAVAATVVAVPAFWVFLLAVDTDTDPTTAIEILTLISWAVLFFAPPTKGRAVFLAGTVALLWIFVVDQVAEADPYPSFQSSGDSSRVEFGDEVSVTFDDELGLSYEESFGSVPDECLEATSDFLPASCYEPVGFDDLIDDATEDPDRPPGIVSMVFGLAYLPAAWALDRRGLTAAATPFILVGAIALTAGSVGAARDVLWLVGIFIVATGKLTVWIAARSRRRGSAWLGLLLVVAGVVTFSADLFRDSVTGFGLLTLGLGVLIAAASAFVAARPTLRGEPLTDDQVLELTKTGTVERPEPEPPPAAPRPPPAPGSD